jgi:hypothetical protein
LSLSHAVHPGPRRYARLLSGLLATCRLGCFNAAAANLATMNLATLDSSRRTDLPRIWLPRALSRRTSRDLHPPWTVVEFVAPLNPLSGKIACGCKLNRLG